MRARAVAACAWFNVITFGTGCAEGFAHPSAASSPLVSEGAGAGAGGASGEGGGGTAGAAGAAGMAMPMFMGEACERGTNEACACTDGVSVGTRACKADAASPTGGVFGECARCVMPTPSAGAGGAAAGAGGMSGGGKGGASGAGSGGSPGAGSGGNSGNSGSGGSSSAGCDPDDCDEPLLGDACCTDDDECGVRLLLSCNAR